MRKLLTVRFKQLTVDLSRGIDYNLDDLVESQYPKGCVTLCQEKIQAIVKELGYQTCESCTNEGDGCHIVLTVKRIVHQSEIRQICNTALDKLLEKYRNSIPRKAATDAIYQISTELTKEE
ncbi:MAG: hypothetical protein HFF04_08660 [Oscillospiraceae bacterium]|nr:hypothetical protein [Oscillospiraceae bacterium]